MRELIVTTFLTLDGVMQAPGGPEEDPSDGFEHGGWSVPFWDDEIGAFMGGTMGKPFDLVLGSRLCAVEDEGEELTCPDEAPQHVDTARLEQEP
jgi:hypothetical protein